MRKKVLLVVIDALTSRVFVPALQEGRLPHMRRLADAGWLRSDCLSIFPSITPAATAAIVTGHYPCRTGITGAYFYDQGEDEVHYYGDDIWVILREGFASFFRDFLVKLNHERLQVDTLFDLVEQAGLRAACLNYLWFHGPARHKVSVPWLLRLWPGVPGSVEVEGPTILCLGDFVSSTLELTGHTLESPGGVTKRFGFHDDVTGDLLLQLAQMGPLPDFTVAYFPENDYRSHECGPQEALTAVENVDAILGKLIAQWESLDAMLNEVAVVLVADHSQTDLIADEERRGIRLDELLSDYHIVPAGTNWSNDEELMVCTNLRAAQIYLREGYWSRIGDIAGKLLSDERVDQVMWRDPDAPPDKPRYHVATADRGRLEFQLEGDGAQTARDAYGGRWQWSGDLRAVDGRIDESGRLQFGDYPNAFERIATVFDERVGGDLWVTARSGYEVQIAGTEVHDGGSHGSLHAGDSTVPLLAAGTEHTLPADRPPRTVDVAGLCLQILDLPSSIVPGSSRTAAARQ